MPYLYRLTYIFPISHSFPISNHQSSINDLFSFTWVNTLAFPLAEFCSSQIWHFCLKISLFLSFFEKMLLLWMEIYIDSYFLSTLKIFHCLLASMISVKCKSFKFLVSIFTHFLQFFFILPCHFKIISSLLMFSVSSLNLFSTSKFSLSVVFRSHTFSEPRNNFFPFIFLSLFVFLTAFLVIVSVWEFLKIQLQSALP